MSTNSMVVAVQIVRFVFAHQPPIVACELTLVKVKTEVPDYLESLEGFIRVRRPPSASLDGYLAIAEV